MESQDTSVDRGILKKAKKKKNKMKHLNEETIVTPLSPDDVDVEALYSDEDIVKKKPKKKKDKHKFCNEEIVNLDDVHDPDSGRDEHVKEMSKKKRDRPEHSNGETALLSDTDEIIVKKKSKKKRDKTEHINEETAVTSPVPDTDEITVKKKSKKKRDKTEHINEETPVTYLIPDDIAAPYDDTNECTGKKKSKKRKHRSEHDEIIIPTDIDATPHDVIPKKKKKHRDQNTEDSSPNKLDNVTTPKEVISPKHDGDKTISMSNDTASFQDNSRTGNSESKTEKFESLQAATIETPDNDNECPQDKQSQPGENLGRKRRSLPNLKDLNSTPTDEELSLIRLDRDPVCSYCDKVFSSCSVRNHHVRAVHFQIKPYVCNVCETAFGEKQTLKVHQRIHTAERSYGCKYCEAIFRNLSNLHHHHRRHERRRLSGLPPVSKSFGKVSNLKYKVIEVKNSLVTKMIGTEVEEKLEDTPTKRIETEKEEELEDEDELIEKLVDAHKKTSTT